MLGFWPCKLAFYFNKVALRNLTKFFLKVLMSVCGCLSVAILLNFWIIIPMIPLSIVFVFIRKYFLASSIEIKRIDGISNNQK